MRGGGDSSPGAGYTVGFSLQLLHGEFVDWDSAGGGVWFAFLVKCGLPGVYYVVICCGFLIVYEAGDKNHR